MKPKNVLFRTSVIAYILVLFTISSCKKDNTSEIEARESEYRQIAWNYLTPNGQATVTTKVEDAPITYLVYKDQQAVSVRFNTTQDSLLGPIVIYISVETKAVLGIAPRF